MRHALPLPQIQIQSPATATATTIAPTVTFAARLDSACLIQTVPNAWVNFAPVECAVQKVNSALSEILVQVPTPAATEHSAKSTRMSSRLVQPISVFTGRQGLYSGVLSEHALAGARDSAATTSASHVQTRQLVTGCESLTGLPLVPTLVVEAGNCAFLSRTRNATGVMARLLPFW